MHSLFQGITFNKGTIKSGLIEIPAFKDKKIKFKSSKESEVEKFKVEDVSAFQFLNDKNKTEKYITLRIGHNKLFNPTKFNIEKNKYFEKIVKQGKTSVYSIHFVGTGMLGRNSTYKYEAVSYFLQRENEDFAFAIGTYRSDLNFMSGYNLYAITEINFEEICPTFTKKLIEADLRSTEYFKIVAIYEENCGKE